MMTSPEPQINNTGFSMGEKRFPLGIGFLITILKKAGHDVQFIDQYLNRDFSFNPNEYEVIGIYANTPCWDGTLDLLQYIEDRHEKDFKILMGGPHASVFPELIPDSVDYIVQGEAEEIICDLVENKIKERIIKTERIKNLDTIQLPDYDSFVGKNYVTTVKWFPEQPVFNMNTSRGCPFNCSFCAVKKIWERKWVAMSSQKVIKDIKYLIEKYKIKGIYFREDNFTMNRDRVVEISEGISPLRLKWVSESRVDTLDREIVKIMAKSGCGALYIGFESGSQRILDILNKKTTVKQGYDVVSWCREFGVKVAGSFIINHPDETDEDRKLTTKFVSDIKPDSYWTNPYRENG